MGSGTKKDITTLLIEWSGGRREALDELMPLVYDTLRQVAARQLRRERADHTLQSTALVHEAYLKLIDQRRAEWQNREQFFAVASQMIRRILVNHARAEMAAKRGGGKTMVALDPGAGAVPPEPGQRVDLLALDELLEQLATMDPQQARIVELRFFGGLSIEAAARVLDISPATVKRDWNIAKAWLYSRLKQGRSHVA
ncbi:MAG TPA: ECF-type sigma factor [Bryobacteraceae bacterium]|nr:ECF-type sigma factor [Bryobacteraceae bacterium]